MKKRAYYPKVQNIRIPPPPNEIQRCPDSLNYSITTGRLYGQDGLPEDTSEFRITNLMKDSSNAFDGSTTTYDGRTQAHYHLFHYHMNETGYCFNSTTYDYCTATNLSYINIKY